MRAAGGGGGREVQGWRQAARRCSRCCATITRRSIRCCRCVQSPNISPPRLFDLLRYMGWDSWAELIETVAAGDGTWALQEPTHDDAQQAKGE